MKQIFDVVTPSNLFNLLQQKTPGQLIIQYTDYCNASCPQCGMRKTNAFKRSTLDKEYVKSIIASAAEKNFKVLSFTGGEPLLYMNEILELSKYATSKGIPYLRTGTNGYMFMHHERHDFKDKMHRLAERISESGLRNIWISIDSADIATHEKMRQLPGVIRGIEKALPIFYKYNIFPAANLGINRNISGQLIGRMENENDFYASFIKGFSHFYSFVINLGFTIVNACYPMSLEEDPDDKLQATYQATSTDDIVKFSDKEKIQIFNALMHVIPLYRSKIRIFTPRTSLLSLIRQYEGSPEKTFPCRGGIDYFFINALDGNTYPCGYRGKENLGDFRLLDINKLNKTPCRECDWECFRDPSELLGNVLQLFENPLLLLEKYKNDKEYSSMLRDDLKYYYACDFFNSKQQISLTKLSKYRIVGGNQ